MSFLAPKTELPNGLADNTPGRTARLSPTQVVPLVLGRGRVVVQWVTPVLHWQFRTTKTSQHAFFSCYGWLCLGPVDELVQILVNGRVYCGIHKFREDYPGSTYVDQVLSKETPERFRLWWGEETTENPTGYLQSLVRDAAHPMAAKIYPKDRGLCRIAVQDMEAGQSSGGQTPSLPKVEVELYRRSPTAYSFGYAAHGTHPIGIVKDLLTLKRGGLKLPDGYFNAVNVTAQMQAIMDVGVAGAAGNELFTSFVFAEPKEAGEQISEVLSYIDGFLVERGGKLEFGYSPNDGSTLDPANLTVISQHHLADGDIQDDPGSLDPLPSQVIVNGLDWTADPPLSEAAETAQVPFARRLLGEQRPPKSFSRTGFTTRRQLKSCAVLMAAIAANPDWEATVPILKQYALQPDGVTPIRPGDLFILNVDQVGGVYMIVRVLSRESDTPVAVTYKVRRERGTFPKPYEPTLDPRSSTTPPAPVDLVRYAGAALPPALTAVAAVTMFVERPSNSVQSYEVHLSPTNTWPGQVIATLNQWAVAAILRTTLAADNADVTVTIDTVGKDWVYLTSQSALQQSDDVLLAFHGREWFSVGTITPLGGGSYSIALKRARLDSTAAAHAIGDVIFFAYQALVPEMRHASFDDIYIDGAYDATLATKYFKLRPSSNGGKGNLTAAFSLQIMTPDVELDDPNLFYDFRFRRSPTLPATPIGENPVGWSDGPPAGTDPLWMSRAVKSVNTGAIVTDWTTPVRFDGNNPIIGVLTNESHTVPAAADGSSPILTGAVTDMIIFIGATDDTAHWTFASAPSAGVTGAFGSGGTANRYTIATMTADSGYVDITASKEGLTSVTKRMTLAKAKQGGDAMAYWLNLSTAAIQRSEAGAYTPASIVATGKSQAGVGAPADFAGRFVIADSPDGATFTNRYTSGADESSKNYVPNAGIAALRVRFYAPGGTAILLDEQIVPIVFDGAAGNDGASVEVQYSADGATAWHFPFVTGDLFARQRVGGGAFSAAFRIVGEVGAGELVFNPDFSLGPGGQYWEHAFGTTWQIADGNGELSWGARTLIEPPYQLVNQRHFPVKSGERYVIRGHVNGSTTYVRITIFDNTDTEMAYITTPNGVSGWSNVEQFGTIPIGGVWARAEVLGGGSPGACDLVRVAFIPQGVAYTEPDSIVPPVQVGFADAGGGLRTVTLLNDDGAATIQYTVNGGAPTAYSAPFTVAATDVVRSWAQRSGYTDSPNSRLVLP